MNVSWKSINRYALTSCALLLMSVMVAQARSKVELPENYPRVANYFLDPNISNEEAEELAQWDIIVLGFETHYTSADAFSTIKQKNPDSIVLAYVPSEEVPTKHLNKDDNDNPIVQLYSTLSKHEEWYLKNTHGEYLNFYPKTRMINVTTAWKKELPTFMTQLIKKNPNHWDGIFYDNCFNNISWVDPKIDLNRDGAADNWEHADRSWKKGMETMMQQTRQRNRDAVILCNSNGDFYTNINGRLIEAFPSAFDGGWSGAMAKYEAVLNQARDPRIVIVNTVANSSDSTNYRLMRYNLTSTLMADGFSSFDQSVNAHNSLWWYDEYSIALGAPLGGPYNVHTEQGPDHGWSSGAWRRNFERGIVLVNSSESEQIVVLEDGFEKILGTQDAEVNNGKIVGSVKLSARDGVILQGRIAQVVDAPYINGTYAKVFNAKGKQVRNSFFSYNSTFVGSETIVVLSERDTTVVASSTFVSVYRGDRLLARFAPYGEVYDGGITLAVGRLDGERKGYRIVTGTQTYGSQVRIYSLRGKLLDAGCFPFGKDARGGVNVAIGDVLLHKRGEEIIVGAKGDSGPMVRILDRRCTVVDSGFFAYNQGARYGVAVAAGDADNDGDDDIVTIPEEGGAPLVRLFTGKGKRRHDEFYAFTKENTDGAQIAVSDVDGNGTNEIVAMSFSIFTE